VTTVRLTLRQHRGVVLFAIGFAGLLTIGATVAWAALSGLSTPAHCIEDRFLVPMPPECEGTEAFLTWNEELAGKVMAAMAVLPLLTGILLGAPLVASEIETRTATIAWSLAPSRRRWLAARLAILATVLAITLVVPAIAAQALAGARPYYGEFDPSTTALIDYGLRGPLVVARGLAAFAIGVVAGLSLGRILPALLVAGVLVVVLWNVSEGARYWGWPPAESVVREKGHYYIETGGATTYVDSAGRELTWDEVYELAPMEPNKSLEDEAAFMAWVRDTFEERITAIPGEKLGFVEQREAAALAVLTVGLLGGSLLVIERRRPA
jgi:hypothetical protein